LQTLDCRYNQLTSLEGLQACPGLQTLDCSENQLTNLEPLRALTGLQSLDCRENQLTCLEPLHGLKSLKKLECGSNLSLSQPKIERFLTNKKRCWWSLLDQKWRIIFTEAIGIGREPTEDELVTILSLTQLDCHFKELTHLEPLRALTGLQTLGCSHNQLTSLEPLRALTGLQTLGCSHNQLTSLEPLYGLNSLKKLECRSNPSLSESDIERFQKAVPSCQAVHWIGSGLIVPPPVDQLQDNRWSWWSSLDEQWCAIFKEAIGIESEPTAEELVTILSLTELDCHSKELTSLEPLQALTGLQTLNCSGNPHRCRR